MKFPTLCIVAAVASFCPTQLVRAATYHVSVDTGGLSGSAGYIAFDLLGGDPSAVNVVELSGFASSSTLLSHTVSGSVAGVLPADLTFTSSNFFNEYLQAVTFAAGNTAFDLTLPDSPVVGAMPDQFSIFLLDPLYAPYATSDATGASALVSVDLTDVPTFQVNTSSFAIAGVVPVAVASPVNEPSARSSLLISLAALLGVARLKRSRNPRACTTRGPLVPS